ncbi:glycosyltransferase family 4 protein [Litoribacter ruber]|nr:glycosyltransferase family 4 protein [Litoribacter ruber]
MNLVFLAHPEILGSQSMPRFAEMMANGMAERGHSTEIIRPSPHLAKMTISFFRKWFGYIDAFLLFPLQIRRKLKGYADNTLFVILDHALGPWVFLVADRPHVIHCHDFLAQKSAFGEIPEHPTAWSGRRYQSLIRWGYSKGQNFISVSEKTQSDLHRFLVTPPNLSEVVYNGINKKFSPMNQNIAQKDLSEILGIDLSKGFILHVGGNQWYKNREGVIEIYDAWRSTGVKHLPLLLVGKAPDAKLNRIYSKSDFKNDIYFIEGLEDRMVRMAYAGASLFLFPSLAEGFGWPIAEAMASGCPVITTNEPPMTEVAGDAAHLISIKPTEDFQKKEWAKSSAKIIDKILCLSPDERFKIIEKGLHNVKRFEIEHTLNQVEKLYLSILKGKETHENLKGHCQHGPL